MPNIRHELLISASIASVYDAITNQERLSQWWTPDTSASAVENTVARFAFGPEYYKEMQIEKLEPFNLVRWICKAGAKEWIGTTISFHLSSLETETLSLHAELNDQVKQQENGSNITLLAFCHDNWRGYTAMYAECNYTWGQFLRSLKLYCETGKGRPWPNQHRVL